MRLPGVVVACVAVSVSVSLAASLGSCADPAASSGDSRDFSSRHDGGDLAEDDLHVGSDSADFSVGACDLGSPLDGGDETLLVSAVTTGGAPYVAERIAGAWHAVPTGGSNLSAIASTSIAGRAMIVTRASDDTLGSSLADPCSPGLAAPTALFDQALTGNTPSAVGGPEVDVVFRGSVGGDERLYASTFTTAWSPATTLGNFVSTQPFTTLRVASDVHVLFTGTNAQIYDGLVNTNGGTPTAIANATSNAGPAAVATSSGTTYLAFLGQNTNLYWAARPMGGSWTAPASLCAQQTSCLITSSLAPVLAVDRAGVPTVAWLGTNGFVYTAQLDTTTSIWSTALQATTETTTLQPALATGVGSDDAEIVYVRSSDGQPRIVSQSAGVVAAAESLPASALATAPSVVRIVAP